MSKDFPLVSVVLCTNKYNEQTKWALDSCVNQDFTDFELIVVCNGDERDAVYSAIHSDYSWFDKMVLLNSSIRHLNHSLNYGVEFARGKYLARMDADDISYPNRLSEQLNVFRKNPSVDICGSWYDYIDDSNEILKVKCLPVTNESIRKRLIWSNPICHPSVMVRTDLLKKSGAYFGGVYAEDYDLWVRLAEIKNVTFFNIDKPLLGYRFTPTGLARKSRLSYANVAATQFRCFANGDGFLWLLSSFITLLKSIFLSKQ